MKKQIYLLTISLLILSSVTAQKISVGFAPFTYSNSSANEQTAIDLYNYVIQAFEATQRFSIKDRMNSLTIISDEQNLARGESFIESDVIIKQGKQQGAEWMVSGQIMAANSVPLEDGSYQIDIAFFVRIFDVTTGELVASEIISPGGRLNFGSNTISKEDTEKLLSKIITKKLGVDEEFNEITRQATLLDHIQKLIPHIKNFIREKFPLEFHHFDLDKNEFGITQIRVIGSEQMGAEKGQIFKVIRLDKISIMGQDAIAKNKIGELKIAKVSGKVFYLEPKNKRSNYVLDLIKKDMSKGVIFLQESGKKATILDSNPFSKDAEKKQRRKDSKKLTKA